MAQDRNIWKEETHRERFQTDERKEMESATGRDKPSGDGGVGDEQVKAVTDSGADESTGKDHSLEDHAQTMPESGVGAVQRASDTSSDIAHIEDEIDGDE